MRAVEQRAVVLLLWLGRSSRQQVVWLQVQAELRLFELRQTLLLDLQLDGCVLLFSLPEGAVLRLLLRGVAKVFGGRFGFAGFRVVVALVVVLLRYRGAPVFGLLAVLVFAAVLRIFEPLVVALPGAQVVPEKLSVCLGRVLCKLDQDIVRDRD